MSSKKRSAKRQAPKQNQEKSQPIASQSPTPSKAEVVKPFHPPLTDEETLKASTKQIAEFPTVIRTATDVPVSQQAMGLVSIKIFDKPQTMKDRSVIYGFMKIRGNWSDKSQAEMMASKIIREQDSANVINIVPVGVWFPITDAKAKEVVDVNISEKDHNEAHKIALKETEEHNNRIQQQLKDRAKEVVEAPDHNDDKDALNYYTLKRVALMFATENITNQMIKTEQLKKQRLITIDIIKDLDAKHPEYKEAWIDNYNVERKKAGIPDFIPSEYERERYTQSEIVVDVAPMDKEGKKESEGKKEVKS